MQQYARGLKLDFSSFFFKVTVLGYLLLILVFVSGCISSIILVLGIRNQNVSYIGQWLIVFVLVAAVEVLKELVDVCLSEDGFVITLIYVGLLLGESIFRSHLKFEKLMCAFFCSQVLVYTFGCQYSICMTTFGLVFLWI